MLGMPATPSDLHNHHCHGQRNRTNNIQHHSNRATLNTNTLIRGCTSHARRTSLINIHRRNPSRTFLTHTLPSHTVITLPKPPTRLHTKHWRFTAHAKQTATSTLIGAPEHGQCFVAYGRREATDIGELTAVRAVLLGIGHAKGHLLPDELVKVVDGAEDAGWHGELGEGAAGGGRGEQHALGWIDHGRAKRLAVVIVVNAAAAAIGASRRSIVIGLDEGGRNQEQEGGCDEQEVNHRVRQLHVE